MDDWYEARVQGHAPEGEGMTQVTLDVGSTPLAGLHAHAGQYVKVKVKGSAESLFALASAPRPDAHRFELLVKAGAPVADALLGLQPGEAVHLSKPLGRGFPIDQARGKDVLLVATGSGISPIRSAIEVIRSDRKAFGKVSLYFGARTPHAFAYAKGMGEWTQDRIAVTQVVSQPGDSGWTGLTGHVQSHIREVTPETVAFLCGQKAMVQAVTEVLLQRGLRKEQIHLNF